MPVDFEILKRYKPEPRTEREEECVTQVSDIDYAVYSTKLELACDEGRELLVKMGVSTVVLSGDTCNPYFTASGDMAFSEIGTFLHAINGVMIIKWSRKYYMDDPTVGVRDGDAFWENEANFGGIHNADQFVLMPIFYKGELIAWCASGGHETESGAIEPGGNPPSAKTRWDEGLKVPPLKFAENFQIKRDVMELIENNMRTPFMITNDTYAKFAVCMRLRSRLLELCEKKGVDFVIGLLRKQVENSEAWARARVELLPDGIYRCSTFLDVTGTDVGLIRLSVAMIKKGDSVTLDCRNVSPQLETGAYNCMPHHIIAHMASNLFQHFFSDLRASSACMAPFDVLTSKNSILDCDFTERAINMCAMLNSVVLSGAHICLTKALYPVEELRETVPADMPLGAGLRVGVFGATNQWGIPVADLTASVYDTQGMGARYNGDGCDTCGFWWIGMAEAPDLEYEESSFPFFVFMRNQVTDSCGAGKFRGGLALSWAAIIKDTPGAWVGNIGHTAKIPSMNGIYGGYSYPPRVPVHITNADWEKYFNNPEIPVPRDDAEVITVLRDVIGGDWEFRPSSYVGHVLPAGSAFMVAGMGGAGWGDPLDREPDAVIEDVKSRHHSHWTAQNVYKVAYDPETFVVDYEGTKKLRGKERQDRIARGKKYDEFEKEWMQKRPPEEALRYYGKFPIPEYPEE